MADFEMAPESVHSAGRATYGLGGVAESVASSLLSALDAAAGACDHPEMASACRDYVDTEASGVRVVPRLVETLGVNTGGSANAVRAGDNDAAAAMQKPLAYSQDLTDRLSRPALSAR